MHRRGLDWPFSLLGLRPVRCLTCTRKFYRRYSLSEAEVQHPSVSIGEHKRAA